MATGIGILDEGVNNQIDKRLQERGYSQDVRATLVPKGASVLMGMDSVDDKTFGTMLKNPRGKSPEEMKTFTDGVNSVRQLSRSSPVFANEMAAKYESNPAAYATFMDKFSKDMYASPALSKKVAEVAHRPDAATAMSKLATEYDRDPGGYIKGLSAPVAAGPAPKPSPSAGGVGAAEVAAGVAAGGAIKRAQSAAKETTAVANAAISKAKGKPQNSEKINADAAKQDDRQRLAPAPGEEVVSATTKTAGADATGAAGAVVAAAGATADPKHKLTATEAKHEFDEFMKKDENKEFADLIHKNNLDGEMAKRIERDPERVKTLTSPGAMESYLADLKKGDTKAFLSEFSGPGANPLGMAGGLAGMAGGFGDMLKSGIGALKGMGGFGAMLGGLAESVMGGVQKFMGLMGRMFDAASGAGQISAPKAENSPLVKMANNLYKDGSFSAADQTQLAAEARANLRDGGHLDRVRNTSQALTEAGISHAQQDNIRDGKGTVLVQVTKGPDGKEKIGFKYEDVNLQKVAAQAAPQLANESTGPAPMVPTGKQPSGTETFPVGNTPAQAAPQQVSMDVERQPKPPLLTGNPFAESNLDR